MLSALPVFYTQANGIRICLTAGMLISSGNTGTVVTV